jgi:hypothetical protein
MIVVWIVTRLAWVQTPWGRIVRERIIFMEKLLLGRIFGEELSGEEFTENN